MINYKQLCIELATLAKRKHRYCEDSWYSCPKAADGCADDSQGSDCNCGADAHNAKVDALVAALTEPEPVGPTDADLLETLKEVIVAFSPRHPEALGLSVDEYEIELEIRKARALIARWGK